MKIDSYQQIKENIPINIPDNQEFDAYDDPIVDQGSGEDDDFLDGFEEDVPHRLSDGTVAYGHPDDAEDLEELLVAEKDAATPPQDTPASVTADLAADAAAPTDQALAASPETQPEKDTAPSISVGDLKIPEAAQKGALPPLDECMVKFPLLQQTLQGPPSFIDTPLQGVAVDIEIDDCKYMFRPDGLYGKRGKNSSMTKLSSPFQIIAQVVDEEDIPFGVLLNIPGPKKSRTVVVELRDLATKQKKELRILGQNGLWISTSSGAQKLLANFISRIPAGMNCIRGTFRTGFHEVGGRPYFVLPGRTFPQTPESPVFISEGGSLGAGHYEATCDIRTWQEKVGTFCQGNHILTFAVCIPLASIYLRHFNMQGAGVHFWGRSATGKSTAALVAASVMLGKFENTFRNWNATANGLEAVCEINDEGCFCLDEIGECTPKDVYNAIYMISNGRSKKRFLDKDIEQKQWRLMYISTGERSSKAHLEHGGIKQETGQALRLLDIPVEVENGYGAFHHIPAMHFRSPAEFSQYLRQEAENCRGAVMEAYLDAVLSDFPAAKQFIEDQMALFELTIPAEDEGQVQRAHKLFALCAAAGEFGIQQGILPWAPRQAIEAAKYAYEVWLASFRESSVPEADKIMERFNSVLIRYGENGFLKYQGANAVGSLGNAFGYRQNLPDGSSHLILPPDGFANLFEGFEPRTVCAVLKQKGMLLTEGRNNTVKRSLPGNHITRCYVIKITR